MSRHVGARCGSEDAELSRLPLIPGRAAIPGPGSAPSAPLAPPHSLLPPLIVTISPLASANDDAHWRVGDSMGLSETSSPKPRSPVTQLGELRHMTSSGQGHPVSQKAGVIGWPSEDSWRVSNAATQAGCLACANYSVNNTYFYSHLDICVHCSSS